jgi:two-component system, OmpR family, phosphate regulon sensor histidine kinase PhoR
MNRLKIQLIVLFLLIVIPTSILLWRSYTFLRSEAVLGYKENSYLLLQLLNQRLYDHLAIEENRSYSEYRFIKAVRVIGGEEVTLSDLALYPIKSHYSGMIGHFQMEPDGRIKTPIMPEGALGNIPIDYRRERREVRNRIRTALFEVDMDQANAIKRYAARTFGLEVNEDALRRKGVTQRNLPKLLSDNRFFTKRYETSSQKESIVFDVESELIPSTQRPRTSRQGSENLPKGTFEVEIDPFQARFNKEHIVFFRNVRRAEDRFLQGFIVNLPVYLNSLVYGDLQFEKYHDVMTLQFSRNDSLLVRFGKKPKANAHVLMKTFLQFPFHEMEITILSNDMNTPQGAILLVVLGVIMLIVLGGSFLSIYKAVKTQDGMSRKRQDFISAVSHELKTPLTSIQMYGELLQNGWILKEERRQYYYTLIASEADRLGRMIQNVLNLSKLERDTWQVNMQKANPHVLMAEFVQKYQSTWEHKGFAVNVQLDECDFDVNMDPDALFQVLMNIVDNSLKFSKDAPIKRIDLQLRVLRSRVTIIIRDYGPGIPNQELAKVFENFYRVENEMTRTTSGTGIGLSLVKNLIMAMEMDIEVENAVPGLRTYLRFKHISSL